MKTSRPFATITYNTDKFLVQKLGDLIKRDIISFYAYIHHYAEDDELKEHKHLYIVPNGQIETNAIIKFLEEIDLQNPTNPPLGCKLIRSSKFDDWYLYGLHDTAYLASKGQSRKHHYREQDFVVSCPESFHELVTTVDYSKYRKTQDFVDKILQGVSFYDMVRLGQVPAPQFMQWKQLYDFIFHEMTWRADRETHTPAADDDPVTGEVMQIESALSTTDDECPFV